MKTIHMYIPHFLSLFFHFPNLCSIVLLKWRKHSIFTVSGNSARKAFKIFSSSSLPNAFKLPSFGSHLFKELPKFQYDESNFLWCTWTGPI